MNEKKVILQDIADRLSISKVTVSKALSNKEGVSDELRKVIHTTAKDMGYMPIKNKNYESGKIAVLVRERYLQNDLYQTFYMDFYQQLVSKLMHADFLCSLMPVKHSETNIDKVIDNLLANKISDVIIMGPLKDIFIEKLRKSNLNILFLDYYLSDHPEACVAVDNFYGAYEITKYLIDRGHRKIGFVGTIRSTASILDRYLGYLKALYEKGLNPSILVDDRDANGKEKNIYLPNDLPTAFVCNCGETAFKVAMELEAQDLKIPADISIVTFDDDSFSKICKPPLTTMKFDIESMVDKVIQLITRTQEQEECDGFRTLVAGNIIERQSVRTLF